MELKPTEPPGHARRKLRGLVSEIARLRAEGYTIRAIHQALADAGVEVGWATVQREVARLAQPSPAVTTARQPAAQPATPSEAAKAAKPGASSRPAVDVDRYFDQQANNPLFTKKGSKR
jgi:hypothetical protein